MLRSGSYDHVQYKFSFSNYIPLIYSIENFCQVGNKLNTLKNMSKHDVYTENPCRVITMRQFMWYYTV